MIILRKIFLKMIKVNTRLLLTTSLLLIFFSTYFITKFEPETFPHWFDGLWWVMTTVTTVGYGDYYPVTVEGRILAMFLYIVGIGLIGVIIGKVVDVLSGFRKKREEGRIVYKGKGHYIIIGWSKKAKYALKEMLNTKEDKIDIVIVDDMDKAPILDDNIFYVSGDATSEETLLNANVKEAMSVLIFADDSIQDSKLIDGKTLLIASTIEAIASNVHTIVEVMEEEHIKNFKHVKVDDFIFSHETISSLAVRSAFTKGISGVFGQLLRRKFGDDLYHVPVKKEWKTYKDAFDALIAEGATLIADGQNLGINRMLHEDIPDNAKLFVVCDKETFDRIVG
ncbi:voltage-gated potassium channel [Salirhabdus euzebyi]|uniref:Voltage-gated potassium channel n=1 Tax=Salirhabdus euzebyi TaxID=394506 RepID=A0A841PWE6_9BACI|nr:potassium channel family protein [Salirhabdus euzebyi]MBB6452164.1 voltage-gated potassium channel [Salirhabdus euzebyi]